MLGKIKKNYFTLVSTILFLYFFFNLLDGERCLISYYEKKNLLESFPEEVKKIENLLEKFNSEQKEPLFMSSYDAPIMIDKYDGQKYEEGDEYIYWSN